MGHLWIVIGERKPRSWNLGFECHAKDFQLYSVGHRGLPWVIKQQTGMHGNFKYDSDYCMEKNRKAGDQFKSCQISSHEKLRDFTKCFALYFY